MESYQTTYAIDYREFAGDTIQEVAERAGVSSATVSRVLNGNSKVSDANRDRVRDAVAELAYRPNRVALAACVDNKQKLSVSWSRISRIHISRRRSGQLKIPHNRAGFGCTSVTR